MPITRQKKATIYQTYQRLLSNTIGMVVAEYRGMRMKDIEAVRNALRPVDGKLAIIKSTIFRIALREAGFAAPKDLTSGPVAVAIAKTDLAKVTKTIMGIKDQPLFILKGAIMGQTVFKADQLEALSNMPTLEEARASLIGTLVSPASQLANLLNQPAQQIAMVLKAFTDKQQGGEAA
jgi:large subunit ribosomal protein L10